MAASPLERKEVRAVISHLFGNRRAERFAQLLDEAHGSPRHHRRSTHDETLAPLVEVAKQVSAAAPHVAVDADPAFRTALRQRLLAVAAVQGIGRTATAPQQARDTDAERLTERPSRTPKIALALTVTAAVVALSGMSAASDDAVPGDALYGVKRSTERAQLALAGSDVNRGQLFLQFARTRLSEARVVKHDRAALIRVLEDMDAETRQGVRLLTTAAVDRRDPAGLEAIDTFVGPQRRQVGDLVSELDGDARRRALGSLSLLDDIQRRSGGLRQGLLCTAAEGTQVDELGPIPRRCSALPAVDRQAPGTNNGAKTSRDNRDSQAPGPTTSGGLPIPAQPVPSSTVPPVNPDSGNPAAEPAEPPRTGPSPSGGLVGKLGSILGGLLD